LAADLRAKAEAVESEEDFQPHMHQGNGFAGSNSANGPE
jgi:hypothetical protein